MFERSADGYSMDELNNYMGCSPKAEDFDEFWRKAIKEVDSLSTDCKLIPSEYQSNNAECFYLHFKGVNDADISAKYLRPKKEGRHPCIFWFHGYTMGAYDWAMYLPYIAEDMCIVSLECRGQGSDCQDRLPGPQAWTIYGEILRGIREGAENLAFRRIYQDAVQIVRIVEKFPEVDETRMATTGTSQGGAISTVCSALHGGMRRTIIGQNFVTDFQRCIEAGYTDIDSISPYSEIGQYLRRFDARHEHISEMLHSLSYIDTKNFAPMIKNPTLMCMTLKDHICPPSTHFAVFNNLGGPKKKMIYPDYDHEDALPGWYDASLQFLREMYE